MFSTTMWTVISAVLGILGTALAWKYNPTRRMYDELDQIEEKGKQLKEAEAAALVAHNGAGDSDALTIIASKLKQLRNRKAILLQRLGKGAL